MSTGKIVRQEDLVYDDKLPLTPGWTALPEEDKEWLQKTHSDDLHMGQAETIISVSRALHLYDVEQRLQGKTMKISHYIKTRYGGNYAMGWERLKKIKLIIEKRGETFVRAFLSDKGVEIFKGATTVGLGDLLNAVKQLPAPKSNDPKTIEGQLMDVRKKVTEDRANRVKGRATKLKDEDAITIMFRQDKNVLDKTKGFGTTAERKAVLKTLVGYLMQFYAIGGKLECVPLSIPEGVEGHVGRPRKAGE